MNTTKMGAPLAPLSIFLNVRASAGGFRAEWFSRRVSTVMYSSKKCASRDEAETLAYKWLARENGRGVSAVYADTTRGKQ